MLTKQQQIKIKKSQLRLIICLIVGLILFILPTALDAYTKYQQGPMVKTYQKQKEELAKRKPEIAKYNQKVAKEQVSNTLEPINIKPVLKDTANPLGYLTIPSINLDKKLIYYGTNDATLAKGLGYMEWTSLPAGGKNTLSAITGHSGMANQIFFDNIKFLKKGDSIQLETFGNTLNYQVTGQKTIDPNSKTAFKNFYIKPGKDMIALMTCTPVFINSKRLIIYAKRIPDKATKTIVRRDFWSISHIWMMLVALLTLIFIIGYLIQLHKYRKLINESTK